LVDEQDSSGAVRRFISEYVRIEYKEWSGLNLTKKKGADAYDSQHHLHRMDFSAYHRSHNVDHRCASHAHAEIYRIPVTDSIRNRHYGPRFHLNIHHQHARQCIARW